MPRQRHYYGLNHLHYLTCSTYRRARLFDSDRFKRRWVQTLGELRSELGFRIIGYVLMPEHFHLLIWPWVEPNPSQIMQKLEDRTALFILKPLKGNDTYPWYREMLGRAGGAYVAFLAMYASIQAFSLSIGRRHRKAMHVGCRL